ncbi:MFS transporter [Facklamia sp. P12955]|uniref:MFS transporter n=1 Tax=Facklamia sp. P12955 TaxID=3421946 RepID=UPI003D17949F
MKKNRFKLTILLILTQLGSGTLSFILSLKILQQNKSATDFGIVVMVSAIFSILTSLISGKYIDRFPKKNMMIVAQFLSIVGLILFIFGTGFSDKINLYWVIALSIVLQVSDSIFTTTLMTSAVNIVNKEEELDEFNSIVESINGICALIAPFIASSIFIFLKIDSFIFLEIFFELFAVLLILNLPLHDSLIEENYDDRDSDYSLNYVLKYAWKNKLILILSLSMLSINLLLGSLSIGLPYLILSYFESKTIFIGIFQITLPVGMMLGAIIYPKLNFKKPFYNPIIKSWFLLALSVILLGFTILIFSNHFWALSIISFILITIAGFSISIGKIPLLGYFQKTVPQKIQGRLFSLLDVMIESSIPLGAGIYGLLFDNFNIYTIFIFSGLILIIFIKISEKKLRKLTISMND